LRDAAAAGATDGWAAGAGRGAAALTSSVAVRAAPGPERARRSENPVNHAEFSVGRPQRAARRV